MIRKILLKRIKKIINVNNAFYIYNVIVVKNSYRIDVNDLFMNKLNNDEEFDDDVEDSNNEKRSNNHSSHDLNRDLNINEVVRMKNPWIYCVMRECCCWFCLRCSLTNIVHKNRARRQKLRSRKSFSWSNHYYKSHYDIMCHISSHEMLFASNSSIKINEQKKT
jgi:hypothetical protein